MNVIVAVGRLMLINANEALPIRCGKRRPAVTSARRQTAKAVGRINKRTVAMIINTGINETGVWQPLFREVTASLLVSLTLWGLRTFSFPYLY